jgi:homeobox protein cut-like
LEDGRAELDSQRTLNERLEQDLLNIHKPDGLWNPDEEISVRDVEDTDSGSGTNQTAAPMNDKMIQNGTIPFATSAESSILPIVTSQRDRFRQRNAELEEVMGYLVILLLAGFTSVA